MISCSRLTAAAVLASGERGVRLANRNPSSALNSLFPPLPQPKRRMNLAIAAAAPAASKENAGSDD
jgi:hypothetical protein